VIKTYGDNDDIYGGNGKDKIYAGAGNDMVNGGEGKDKIHAGAGNDVVNGGEGKDKMWGGYGSDIFEFEKGSGKDKVYDFNVKYDKIDVSDYGFDSWKDVESAMQSSGWGRKSKSVVINLDDENTVQLVGVKAKHLSEDNFILDEQEDGYVA
jgi:Ca2+-binding RTX toxin-like protein